MSNYKGRLVSAAELLSMFNDKNPDTKIVILVKPDGELGSLGNLDFAQYIGENMLVEVVGGNIDEETIELLFDATNFEIHNRPLETAEFYAACMGLGKDYLTSREIAAQSTEKFTMKEDALAYDRLHPFFLVENYAQYFGFLDEEFENLRLEITGKVEGNDEKEKMLMIGYLSKKAHSNTITDTEKGILHNLLSE